jgi:hypothetical protein
MATVNYWLSKFGLTSLKLNVGFAQMEFVSNDATRRAAWELYVELLTRVSTQSLPDEQGAESSALNSVYQFFPMTREILRKSGPDCVRLAYIAIPFLNQVLRPFTTKWHTQLIAGRISESSAKTEFRQDLIFVRQLILGYADLMGELAGVEADRINADELNAKN